MARLRRNGCHAPIALASQFAISNLRFVDISSGALPGSNDMAIGIYSEFLTRPDRSEVAMRLVTQAPEGRDRVWPDLPYKGLNYYDLTDISIFAGREDDITRCARLVQLPRTKLLFLPGGTGCGKSSFVRAGLIPFLERREFGYSFVREDEAELMSHFVRSTDDPFSRLAEVLFQLGRTQRTRMTPVGLSTVDLSECIQPDQMNLQRFMGRSPENLLEVLSRFARKIPETLVLIFDQVEEVLTLRQVEMEIDHADVSLSSSISSLTQGST